MQRIRGFKCFFKDLISVLTILFHSNIQSVVSTSIKNLSFMDLNGKIKRLLMETWFLVLVEKAAEY